MHTAEVCAVAVESAERIGGAAVEVDNVHVPGSLGSGFAYDD
jgi:hypothetical protein